MTYRKGESGNPAGKPKGANKTQQLRAKLLTAAPAILQSLVDLAKAGDPQAARLILERCLPALRPETRPPPAPVPITADDVLTAVRDGTMTPDQGEQVMSLLLAQARIRETDEILRRLEELESLVGNK